MAGKMYSILAAAGQPLPRPLPPHNSSERGATPPSAMGKYRKPDRKRFPMWFPTLRHALHFTMLYATNRSLRMEEEGRPHQFEAAFDSGGGQPPHHEDPYSQARIGATLVTGKKTTLRGYFCVEWQVSPLSIF